MVVKYIVLVCILSSVAFAKDPRRGLGGTAYVGSDIYLQGKYMEVAINPGGGFGSRDAPTNGLPWGGNPPPAGFHPSSTAYLGKRLGVVTDWDKNGWTVGNPPQSGDFILEATNLPETGWHLSWTGAQGVQKFNQMPMVDDDDSGDYSTVPPRGCTDCLNGQRLGCDPFGDCSCSEGEPSTFYCYDGSWKRWDIVPVEFYQVNMSATSTPKQQRVHFKGTATARAFVSSSSGNTVPIGEQITVTKEMYFNYDDTFVVETYNLQNTGTVDLTNIQLMWHIMATQESSSASPFWDPEDTEANFKYVDIVIAYLTFNRTYNTISMQGGVVDPRVLVYSKGRTLNITTAIGTIDSKAKGWYNGQQNWVDPARRPYSAQWIFDDWTVGSSRLATLSATGVERFQNQIIAVGTQRDSLKVGESTVINVFHAFSADSIIPAFAAITPGCDGVAGSGLTYDTCGICGGNGLSCTTGCDGVAASGKKYDACGVCGGSGSTCKGCDGVANSGKKYDGCGICGGNNSTCKGCDGILFSGKKTDACGQCGGNNSTCKGCDGVANSGKKYDGCGVCGGNNSTCCVQGRDACGVCGGNNSTCKGCDGVPNSGKKYDTCGVCGGPGKTCQPVVIQDNCPVCNNCPVCTDVHCPECPNPCGDFHGYGSSYLDFLIYRYEVQNTASNSLGDLTETLTEQLDYIKFSSIQVSSYLDKYLEFADCVHLTDKLLRDYFNLASN